MKKSKIKKTIAGLGIGATLAGGGIMAGEYYLDHDVCFKNVPHQVEQENRCLTGRKYDTEKERIFKELSKRPPANIIETRYLFELAHKDLVAKKCKKINLGKGANGRNFTKRVAKVMKGGKCIK